MWNPNMPAMFTTPLKRLHYGTNAPVCQVPAYSNQGDSLIRVIHFSTPVEATVHRGVCD